MSPFFSPPHAPKSPHKQKQLSMVAASNDHEILFIAPDSDEDDLPAQSPASSSSKRLDAGAIATDYKNGDNDDDILEITPDEFAASTRGHLRSCAGSGCSRPPDIGML